MTGVQTCALPIGGKNHLRARYCNNCGGSLPDNRAKKDLKGRMKLHADIAHPINADCRQKIQEKVTIAFNEEVEKSKQPGYKAVDLDEGDDEVPEIIKTEGQRGGAGRGGAVNVRVQIGTRRVG